MWEGHPKTGGGESQRPWGRREGQRSPRLQGGVVEVEDTEGPEQPDLHLQDVRGGLRLQRPPFVLQPQPPNRTSSHAPGLSEVGLGTHSSGLCQSPDSRERQSDRWRGWSWRQSFLTMGAPSSPSSLGVVMGPRNVPDPCWGPPASAPAPPHLPASGRDCQSLQWTRLWIHALAHPQHQLTLEGLATCFCQEAVVE